MKNNTLYGDYEQFIYEKVKPIKGAVIKELIEIKFAKRLGKKDMSFDTKVISVLDEDVPLENILEIDDINVETKGVIRLPYNKYSSEIAAVLAEKLNTYVEVIEEELYSLGYGEQCDLKVKFLKDIEDLIK